MENIPCDWLTFTWLAEVSGGRVSKSLAQDLKKKDPKVGRKVFQRVHVVSLKDPFGPLEKSEWWQAWSQRGVQVNGPTVWFHHFFETDHTVDWEGRDGPGHYQLNPPVPADTDPMQHKFSFTTFRMVDFPIPTELLEGVSFNGLCRVTSNWDHLEARVQHPTKKYIDVSVKEILQLHWSRLWQPAIEAVKDENTIKGRPDNLAIALPNNLA